MKVPMKKMVATVAMAGAITAGTAGVAVAQDGSATNPDQPAAGAKDHPRIRLAVRRHVGKIVADTLGVSRQDLRAALKGGQSVREYTESLGKDPAVVHEALVHAANAAIDQAVANGRIDAAKGDEIKGRVPARADKAMDRHFGQGGAS
jgi:hypothetical protein